VKGDPSERRRFADDLLVLQQPRYAGTRSDYDRVLKQRNSLLKTTGIARRGGRSADSALSTLEVWDSRLAQLGAEMVARRLRLVDELGPLVGKAYEAVARGARRDDAQLSYKSSVPLEGTGADDIVKALLEEVGRRRQDEIDRGVTLVGPHRDDLTFRLGEQPVKGYASHGESWSFALALRLASYHLLRQDGDDPVLILDDVFAELDTGRRSQLADLVAGAEQVLITAAVPDDIPAELRGARFTVTEEGVSRDE
jgi:DNA replication and repair protein RecF